MENTVLVESVHELLLLQRGSLKIEGEVHGMNKDGGCDLVFVDISIRDTDH